MLSNIQRVFGSIFFLLVSWYICSLYDFFYPQLYHGLNISEHISNYGPENIYKYGFQLTSEAERLRIFSEIVDAINSWGVRFEQIQYHPEGGGGALPFLRKPEIDHLLDVKHLVSVFNVVGLASGTLYFVLFFCKADKKTETSTLYIKIPLFVLLFVVIIWFKEIFYFLHEVVFPEGNQWFFYYQESLMTTLMKAPDLFFYISLILVIIASLTFIISQALATALIKIGKILWKRLPLG